MEEKKPFVFAQKEKIEPTQSLGTWKVLVVDDEEEVHVITRSVLASFRYDMRELEIISAYSGKEAKEILLKHHDIALILLDVVMEKDDAGLEVARYVREDLKNTFVQIVLRTGQPGSAPEKRVIDDYEINDYKEKTELTSTKLYTTVLTSLRSYKNMIMIEKNRFGLEKILDSTRSLFGKQSEKDFLEGVLTQIEALLRLDGNTSKDKYHGFSAFRRGEHKYEILASTGKFREHKDDIPQEVVDNLDKVAQTKESFLNDDVYVGYFSINNGLENFIYFQGYNQLNHENKVLVELFISKVAIALENMELTKEILDTKREIIYMLGNVVESRSKETANHVQRVAEVSYLLGKKFGLSEEDAVLLRNASPMHDVGKVGIADRILLKPGRLDDDEYKEMKRHTEIGYDILKVSERDLIKAAAIIAHQHHERWDGMGYPRGLKGDNIHIYGRITSVADVFDALFHKRCYKEPWGKSEIMEYFANEKGKQFDPVIARLFLEHINEIFEVDGKFA
jgi:response regulator RpfG family c-di-GMP phosphodiesterase